MISKRNFKAIDDKVYEELEILQRLRHPNIVQIEEWFESIVRPDDTKMCGL